jgi:hypothetical protein
LASAALRHANLARSLRSSHRGTPSGEFSFHFRQQQQ